MRWIRILKRKIRDSSKSIIIMPAIICTTSILIIVSIFLIVSYNTKNNTTQLESEKESTIIVYLKRETTEEQSSEIQATIKKMDSVKAIKFKSKDELRSELKGESDLETSLDYLDSNPLLDSIIITVTEKDLKSTMENIRKIENISSAEYGEQIE